MDNDRSSKETNPGLDPREFPLSIHGRPWLAHTLRHGCPTLRFPADSCLVSLHGRSRSRDRPPSMQPPSSMRARSRCHPYPRSTHHLAPWVITRLNSFLESRTNPLAPTPDGTFRKSSVMSCSRRGCTSASVNSVRISRMPQLMSYPTPPGEIMPSCTSNAATPPIGNP